MVATKSTKEIMYAEMNNPNEKEFSKKRWVSLDEHNKLKDKFTIKQICKKCGGKTYCLGCDKERFFAPKDIFTEEEADEFIEECFNAHDNKKDEVEDVNKE